MRRELLVALLVALLAGCAETVRCPDGQVFADDGSCVPIGDGGQADPNDGGDGG